LQESQAVAREPLWSKPFFLVILVNFFMFTSMYVLLPTLPVFARKIGGSDTVAGLIVGLFTLSAVLIRPWSGNLLDRKGRKIVLVAGILIFLFASISYNWAYMVWLLLVLRVIHGAGWGFTTTAAGTIASDVIPAPRRGEGMGYYGISTTIAMSIGPALGLFIVEQYSFTVLFVVSAAFAVSGLLAGLLINYQGMSAGDNRITGQGVIIERSAVPPSLVLFFVALTYGGVVSFLPSSAAERGIANIGPFFTVYAIVLLLSRPVMGKLADRYGAGLLLVPGIALVMAALISLMTAVTLPMFLLAAVLYGLAFGAVQPVLNAVTITLAPVERRGAANATFFSAMDLGIGLGAVILGAVSQRVGYSLMYGSSSVFVFLALTVYFTVLRGKLAQHRT